VVGIFHALVTILLTFMVAAFMSIDLPRFTGFFRGLVPADHRAGYDDLLERIDRGLSGVVRGQLIICVINGILTYVGLAFLGVKFSLLLALLAGVLSLIPVFGTIVSTMPIVLVGLMSGFWTGFLALCWILVIHFIEGNILNPQIIGTSAHIHPVIVIFALLAGQSAFGLVGALLAVPVASILLEIFHFARDKMSAEEDAPPVAAAATATPGSDGTTGA
jgi:predicted PurR-regulated permease PerM